MHKIGTIRSVTCLNVLMKMLLIQLLFGMTWFWQTYRETIVNLVYRWFCRNDCITSANKIFTRYWVPSPLSLHKIGRAADFYSATRPFLS